ERGAGALIQPGVPGRRVHKERRQPPTRRIQRCESVVVHLRNTTSHRRRLAWVIVKPPGGITQSIHVIIDGWGPRNVVFSNEPHSIPRYSSRVIGCPTYNIE